MANSIKENDYGTIGDLFDFNNDGKLDAFEKAVEFSAFMDLIDSAEDEAEPEGD